MRRLKGTSLFMFCVVMRPVNNCSSDKGIYVIRPLSCNFLSLSCTNKTSKKINYHHTEMWMKCRLMTLSLISNPAQVKTQTQNKCHSELPIQNQNRNSMEKNDYTSSIQKLWNDCYLPLAETNTWIVGLKLLTCSGSHQVWIFTGVLVSVKSKGN